MNYTEKNKLLDKISLIILMGIFALVFLYGVDFCYTQRMDTVAAMPWAMIVFAVVFVLISVGIFAYAKKKDKNAVHIYGFEFIGLAVICLLINYWYYPKFYGLSTNWFHQNIDHRVLWIVVLVYFAARVIYSCYDAIRKSNSHKLKKKKA